VSNSLILSATREHLHSVLSDVAVRMSSLATSGNLQPNEESPKRFCLSKVTGEPRSIIFRYNHLLLRCNRALCISDKLEDNLVSWFARRKIRREISARTQVVLFVFYAIHVQLKNSERQISLSDESSPSPRSGSAVDKARRTRHRFAWPSLRFLFLRRSAVFPRSSCRFLTTG